MGVDGMNWDLTPYFPEFNGKDMTVFKETLESDSEALLERSLDHILCHVPGEFVLLR